MSRLVKSILLKLLLVFALLNTLLCPMLFGLVMFAPEELSFLDPVVCPLICAWNERQQRRPTKESIDSLAQGEYA